MLFSGNKEVRIVCTLFLYKGSSEERTQQESALKFLTVTCENLPSCLGELFWANFQYQAQRKPCWLLRHPPGDVLSDFCPWCAQSHPQHPRPKLTAGIKTFREKKTQSNQARRAWSPGAALAPRSRMRSQ